MSTPSQPLLASLLPVSPDHDLLYWNGKTSVGLTPEQVQGILRRARSGDFWLNTPAVPEKDALRALALALDPETGESLLHIATAFTGEPLLGVQQVIHQTDQKSCGQDRSAVPRARALQTLLVHQNYTGDSALHMAARSGVQNTVTFLYRAFWRAHARDSLDSTDDASLPELEKGEELDVEYREMPLAWLMVRNVTGQTAADAARAAGHADVAAWLDKIVTLLNYDGSFNEQDIPRVIKDEFQ